ncbi:MAG TPA: hypothetical protein PK725_13315 [Rhodocyclaceae bacterium]|nr:hypothetical protein [Rhodocyclaceae bacterium]
MPPFAAHSADKEKDGMDIDAIIRAAKLGRERKDAQVETCTVFAAALYDVLSAQGIQCEMVTVVPKGLEAWAHALVAVAGRYYDSMGEFSADIYRTRAKIHPKVRFELDYRADARCECYEPEFDELHAFFVNVLTKTLHEPAAAAAA